MVEMTLHNNVHFLVPEQPAKQFVFSYTRMTLQNNVYILYQNAPAKQSLYQNDYKTMYISPY